jgi:hypothetical protein
VTAADLAALDPSDAAMIRKARENRRTIELNICLKCGELDAVRDTSGEQKPD